MSAESVKSDIIGIEEQIQSVNERIQELRNRYSTFELFDQKNRHKLVRECLAIIEPALNNNFQKIDSIIASINKLGPNNEMTELKSRLLLSMKKVNTALEEIASNGNEKSRGMAIALQSKVSGYINKLS
ncbi:MAG: hypothetical protein PHE25_01865 [Candidatus Gracilibacteria bacterium]|nr:hypothetical protein [Candidatus Gracilibacteria bacterium]